MKEQPKLNVSIKRPLINLSLDIEGIRHWIFEHGHNDYYSSIKYYISEEQLPIVGVNILLLEDRRFFKHGGAEIWAIPRGLRYYLKRHKFGGISTIEQQLVRTIRKRREYTISRKFSEITLSILMNFHFTKAEILTTYLNCVYFGPHMNGVDTAALVSFGVPAISLTEEQADFIACLLPTPMPRNIALSLRKYGPALNPETILTNFEITNPWWVNSVRTRNRVLSLAKIKYSKLYAKASH